MSDSPLFRRRNYFIKKKFQVDFTIKFLIIILIEVILAIGFFIYLSRGTLTTGFVGSDFRIAKTSEYFLPTLFLANLIILAITGVIGIAVMIFMSHRIAGPLHRFEKVLEEIGKGDLTHRFKLRDNDQLSELADSITELTVSLDKRIRDAKLRIQELSALNAAIQSVLSDTPSADKELKGQLSAVSKKIEELEEAVNYFRTSEYKGSKGL
ncbi:MAG: methyl-accepting chemotaxis protein [Nitrospirae bacterium]|nr:methyl-accepting chemotaxis protein [Nitrospirota bacterium]